MKKIKNALISVFYKDKLDLIARLLHQLDVNIYATGGTYDYIQKLKLPVTEVESLTGYPSILDGRVKTLHPKVFGGILARSSQNSHRQQLEQYEIPAFDLVIVDLYPFEQTVAANAEKQQIVEKIDIGGISLIRAAAKNYEEVLIVPSVKYYDDFIQLLKSQNGKTSLENRLYFAGLAFGVSSHYDAAIYNWFGGRADEGVRLSLNHPKKLRYGENPHQDAFFYGELDKLFMQLHGKELSYNNLLDLDAGLNLIKEFDTTTFAILKHNNACGIASRDNLSDAYEAALAGDPVSAFGGVLISNHIIDEKTAKIINSLFFEIILAPDYEKNAQQILQSRKNRIILQLRPAALPQSIYKTALHGFLAQDKDLKTETATDMKAVTHKQPENCQYDDLVFANKVVKHTRSNAIVLVKNKQLLAAGAGQTSRVDALKQAIAKAQSFGFDLKDAVMASDAFFPFADSVKLANEAGITAIVQPGGSIRDQESIDYCNLHEVSMVFTGIRHFKH
ncbi:MAG: bifunctional phosphoribosylaminoimidazolecarboxamide formyltransferase/IMP cyclohydrolase [Bacteroidales bacterium]|nr:bifunctional phosphoribosylaminoimidazolecarboxamide formyltransferase/IMP cyclohydrolase [Bacteroidales bacterium]